ncbi:unnamed protein product [Effrenium voratum]|nr:unnamed protein product [Effrenium voratum]
MVARAKAKAKTSASNGARVRTAKPRTSALEVGDSVRLVGLEAFAALNGRRGKVVSFDGARQRWQVALEDGVKNVLASNLRKEPESEKPQATPQRMRQVGFFAKAQASPTGRLRSRSVRGSTLELLTFTRQTSPSKQSSKSSCGIEGMDLVVRRLDRLESTLQAAFGKMEGTFPSMNMEPDASSWKTSFL